MNSYQLFVVEDNEGDVVLIKRALRDYGIAAQVTVCNDGESAIRTIDCAEAAVPDAIILDLSVPRVPGLDILRCVLNRPRFSDTPIMVFTSSPSPADKHRVELLGGVRYVQKPSGLDNFLRAVGENVRSMLRFQAKAAGTEAL
ncbi:MAG TPA: response regulator [Bryobacteraceae bacterium]|nr:response regulator [Bryobacteraceae bacterium]